MRTSVELEGPIVEPPIEEVFAFIGDLENSPRWGRTKKTVRDPDSPDGAGAVFQEEARILGEKVKLETEVTRLDPPSEVAYASRFENGLSERTRIMLVAAEEGTRIDIAAEVESDRLPRVLAPVVSLVAKQRIGARFRKLEQEFKPPDTSVVGAAWLMAFGAILVATAAMRYLIEVLPEGEWWRALALFAVALLAGLVSFITWKASRRGPDEEETEPSPVPSGPGDANP